MLQAKKKIILQVKFFFCENKHHQNTREIHWNIGKVIKSLLILFFCIKQHIDKTNASAFSKESKLKEKNNSINKLVKKII